jgi:hypothetical protein
LIDQPDHPEADLVFTAPPDVPHWSENLLFAPYDATTGIGLWLHLGTVPGDWETWEDRVLIAMPEQQGALTLWSYHRTDPSRRPAGANQTFRCVEPFRRWEVDLDGFFLRTPYEKMRTGLVKDGTKVPVSARLAFDCVGPVWDTHVSGQTWATEHYQQLYRASGSLSVGGADIPFNGSGWRDHSRGPRGVGNGAEFGGHAIVGCLLESGRGFGLHRYWSPDGTVTLDGGYVVQDDRLEPAEIVDFPRLRHLQWKDEPVPIGLTWPGGELALTATTVSTMWMTMGPSMPYGAKPGWPGPTYAVGWARCVWDGEPGTVYLERSDPIPNDY